MQLFYNGTIHTMDTAQPKAEAVLVDDNGRIVFVGRLQDANPPANTRHSDLGGATLIPGFNDAHVHIWKLGLLLTLQVDVRLSQPDTMPRLVQALTTHAHKQPNGWILGRGYDEASMTEGRHPTRTDLDAVSTKRPLALTRICGHIMALNTRALELAGVNANTPNPAGGVIERDEHGNPTGVLKESAMALVNRVIPSVTHNQLADAIAACHQHQLSKGITSATDPLLTPFHLEVYRQMEADGRMAVRTNGLAVRRLDGGSETMPLPEKYISSTLRLNSVKFFADGGLSGATAALAVNYKLTGDNGVLRYDTNDMQQLMWEAHEADYRIGTHAIGDRALDQVIGCYEELYRRKPSPIRHRIEHLGLPDADHLRGVATMNVIGVPQTVFLPALGRNFRRYLPDEYITRCYPVRSMWDAGITVALSSDAPVVPDDSPLLGMQAAIARGDHNGDPIAAEEAITAEQALWAYTMGGAIASGDDDNRGSISVSKHADFVILDRDPLQTPTHELTDIRVQQTVLGGKPPMKAKSWWQIYAGTIGALWLVMCVTTLFFTNRQNDTIIDYDPVTVLTDIPTPTAIPTVQQVIAVQQIPAGVTIEESMLALRDVPLVGAINGGYTVFDDVVGKTSAQTIYREQIITGHQLEVPNLMPDVFATATERAALIPPVPTNDPNVYVYYDTPTPVSFVQVIMPVHAIPAGAVIQPEDVVSSPYVVDYTPFNSLYNFEDVVGKVARADLPANYPILTNLLLEADTPNLPTQAAPAPDDCIVQSGSTTRVYASSEASLPDGMTNPNVDMIVTRKRDNRYKVTLPGGLPVGWVDEFDVTLSGTCDF